MVNCYILGSFYSYKIWLQTKEKPHLISCLSFLNLDTLQLLLVIRAHIAASTQLVSSILHLGNIKLSLATKTTELYKGTCKRVVQIFRHVVWSEKATVDKRVAEVRWQQAEVILCLNNNINPRCQMLGFPGTKPITKVREKLRHARGYQVIQYLNDICFHAHN